METESNRSVSSRSRLTRFSVSLLCTFVFCEGFLRVNEPLLEASSHRALAKAAMFGQHPQAQYVFLGSSRTQDGVNPELLTRTLAMLDPTLSSVEGFNAAFTGSAIETLQYIVPRFLPHPNLKLAVIEASGPQILNTLNGQVPWKREAHPDAVARSFEARLSEALQELRLVHYRTAFLGDNLSRLPALLVFGRSLSGWETRGKDQIASFLRIHQRAPRDFDPSAWRLPQRDPASFTPQTLDPEKEAILAAFLDVVHTFRTHGVQVAFAVPPLSVPFHPQAEEHHELLPFLSELQRRSGCELWNFGALSFPEAFFRDPSHLGAEGRAHYSSALARQIVRFFPKVSPEASPAGKQPKELPN